MSKEYLPPLPPEGVLLLLLVFSLVSLAKFSSNIIWYPAVAWRHSLFALLLVDSTFLISLPALPALSFSFSLFEWAGNCLQRQTVCQHLQPVCLSLTLSLGYCTRRSSSCLSSLIYRVCECVCVIHKCALVLNVNICTRNSSRRREREREKQGPSDNLFTLLYVSARFHCDFALFLSQTWLPLNPP